jgi:poly(A) polymerase
VLVVVEGGRELQVATFREESNYTDGRHPGKVAFSNARADALRRDFTVNGLFYDPIAKQLHDWVGGEADLRDRVIRTIGPASERFGEDHLRVLRAVRLAAQLGFQVEPQTLAEVRNQAGELKHISAERIRDELVKLFRAPHAARGLELLQESGLLAQVLPEIAATVSCDQSPDYHPEGTVYSHLKLMLEQMPREFNPLLPWAVLLHDVAKPVTASRDPETGSIHFYGHERIGAEMAREILERLRFPRREVDEVADAVRYHMQFKDAKEMRKSTLRRLLMRSTFSLELELHRLDCLGSHRRLDVYDFLVAKSDELRNQPEIIPPLLRGHDLLQMGIEPGPAIGKLLAEAREMQLQDELRTPEEARDWARKRIQESLGASAES